MIRMKSQLTTGLAGAPNFGTPHAMPISCYYHGHGIIYFNVLILWFFVIFCEFWSSKKASKLVVDLPIAWCLEFGNQGDCSWAPSTTHNIWTKCLLKLWLGTLNKRRSQLSNPQKKNIIIIGKWMQQRELGCPILSRMLAYFSPNNFFERPR
jgi:hypothetical protein